MFKIILGHTKFLQQWEKKNKNYLTRTKVLMRCDSKGCGSTAMQSVNAENREHYCWSQFDNSHRLIICFWLCWSSCSGLLLHGESIVKLRKHRDLLDKPFDLYSALLQHLHVHVVIRIQVYLRKTEFPVSFIFKIYLTLILDLALSRICPQKLMYK